MACRVFDAQVVHTPKDSPRGQLLEQYVCARVVTNTGMNIALFDRDWHNTIYYFVLNADEQIYLRYGGRDETAPDTYLNYDSFELALKLGLDQHEKWKAGELPAKPLPKPFYPDEIPLLKDEVMDQGRCVECHLIADYRLLEKEFDHALNKLDDMFVNPDIKRIGVELDVPKGLVVKSAAGAVAEAGMQARDLITAIEGTPVLTFGDLQYEYNKTPKTAVQVRLTVSRGGEAHELVVTLPAEWWWTDLYHRFWTVEPKMFFTSKPIITAQKRALGLPEDGFASEIVNVDPAAQVYNVHQLKVGDIITAVDGVQRDDFTQKLDIYIALTVESGETFTVDFLRDGEPMQMDVRTYRESFRKPEI
jgi:hypothetical protein